MDKKELKKILKPLMKECVKELLMEEGMFKVLTESIRSTQTENINTGFEEKPTYQIKQKIDSQQDVKKQIQENHKRMLEEIGKSGYLNGVNPFEGVQALSEAQAPEKTNVVTKNQKLPPSISNIDPNDPGVNISGIMNLAAGRWKSHLGGKGK